MVLHQGRIAEMKTGEGKTLVATLPAYLNGLTGRGVHVVTVNDFLARRDAEWMGQVHRFLGLEVGAIVHGLTDAQRQAAYRADITYGTNNELGFDYLRDNMKFSLAACVQRELHYAIVDEVDSILIDEARTPLIISGPSEQNTQIYTIANRLIPSLQNGTAAEASKGIEETGDYWVDEKAHSATFTEQGVHKCESMLRVDNLYDPGMLPVLHALQQALAAHALKRVDVDYVVRQGDDGKKEVVIVDEYTGRLMPGRRWSDGLHQAVEAKEGITVRSENQTLASITFQNYFRMYEKLSGMTGTADTEAEEFAKIYDLDVSLMPTNRPMVRHDHADVVFKTKREKFDAVVEEMKTRHEAGQPVLVGTISIETSEMLSSKLDEGRLQAQRAERQAARARERDRGPGGPQGRDHDLDQHGRPRHRHRARRQSRADGAPEMRPRPEPPRVRGAASRASRASVRPSAKRCSRRAGSTSSAPSATRAAASTTSCAAARAARAIRARPSSSSRSKTICCASSRRTG